MLKLVRWLVYGFLRWFESFDSVWQTTLLCIGVGVFEIGWPELDPHLVAVLLVSLYATFTQNGLAHGNKLNGDKLDAAIETLIALGHTDDERTRVIVDHTGAIVAQAEAIWTAVGELRETVAEVARLAHTEAEVQAKVWKQDEQIIAALTAVREMLEGQAALAHRLVKPIDEQLPDA